MDSLNVLSNVTKLLKKYEKKSPERLDSVKRAIKEKQGKWDKTVKDESGNNVQITEMLLYEYATSIEEITKGRVSFDDVLNKLKGYMDRFRFGDWKEEDSNLKYGKTLEDSNALRINSEEYKIVTRNFGGGTLTYYNENENDENLIQNAVILFDNISKPGVGTELNDLSAIRQVIFHEWTHVMENVVVEEIARKGIPPDIYKENGRYFINAEKLKNGKNYLFKGISTKEIVPASEKHPDGIKMHNRVAEGFVEFVSRRVIETLSKKEETFGIEKYINKGHNFEQTEIAERIMLARGEDATVSELLTNSAKLIGEFENKRIVYIDRNGRLTKIDGLHYMSDYIYNHEQRKTDKMKSLEPLIELTEVMRISRENRAQIRNDEYWSTHNLTPDDKMLLRKTIYSYNNSNITEETFNGCFNAIIEKYEIELEKEKNFFDEIPIKMEYGIRKKEKDSHDDTSR